VNQIKQSQKKQLCLSIVFTRPVGLKNLIWSETIPEYFLILIHIKYASLRKGFKESKFQGFLLQRIDQSLEHPLHFLCQLKYLLGRGKLI